MGYTADIADEIFNNSKILYLISAFRELFLDLSDDFRQNIKLKELVRF